MTEQEARRILGISAETDMQEIKKRYRRLMLQAHPDAADPSGGQLRQPHAAGSGNQSGLQPAEAGRQQRRLCVPGAPGSRKRQQRFSEKEPRRMECPRQPAGIYRT